MKTQINSILVSRIAIIMVAICLFAQAGYSQNTISKKSDKGKIAGKIVDTQTGETIIGANVIVTGTSQGDATDIDGKYSITLDPGIYSITVSYISYTKKTITNVEVEAGVVETLNVALQPETTGLDEITVTAQANKSSEAGLLSVQKKSVAVQDGISSESISKTNDSNVASAIQRVSGVSLVGDNDIYVRGLGNRYSNIQLNGSQIPSTSPNKKEAPVDIISSGIVDNIVVQKTYTSDQSGEFSGGSVKIVTKEFPSSKNLSFSYSTSYNTLSTFGNDLSYKGSKTDFLGFDNGYRQMPEQVKDGTINSVQEGVAVAKQLHNSWTPTSNNRVMPSQKFNFTYANQYNEEKLPVGVVSSVSYKYAQETRPDEQFRDIQNFLTWSDFDINTGRQKTNLSGMLNLFVKPTSTSKIGLKNLYSNSLSDKASIIQGTIRNDDGILRQTILEFDRKSIFSSSLQFENYFKDFYESDLDINLSYSKAVRDMPDRRNSQYVGDPANNIPFEVALADQSNVNFFSNQNDNNYTGEAKYTFKPLKSLTLKVGGSALWKRREFNANRLVYRDLDNSLTREQKRLSPEELFTPGFIESGNLEFVENSQPSDSYDGEQDLYAGYLSSNWFVTPKFNFELGVRAEQSQQKVNNEVVIDKLDFLPAVNTTYRVNENMNIRGAFSITLARPEFRELSKFSFRDFFGGRTVYGSGILSDDDPLKIKRTQIFNYDLRFELYPNSGELFAVSAFYKKFENPIELFFRRTQNNEVFYGSAPEANLYGAELEIRKDITERLKVSTNFSYIISEVTFNAESAQGRLANLERPLYGQSPYTFNLSTYYLIPDIDLEVNATYNTFGKRISAVGNSKQPGDEYEQPFHGVDLTVIKKFGKASLDLGFENILNDKVEFKQGDVITNKYQVGRTFSLGFSYSF